MRLLNKVTVELNFGISLNWPIGKRPKRGPGKRVLISYSQTFIFCSWAPFHHPFSPSSLQPFQSCDTFM